MVSCGQAKILPLKCPVSGLGTRACRASRLLHHRLTPSASSRRLLPPGSSLPSEDRLGSVLPTPDTRRLEPSSLGHQVHGVQGPGTGVLTGEQRVRGGGRLGPRDKDSNKEGCQEPHGEGRPPTGRLQGVGDPEVEGSGRPGGAGASAEPAAPRI